MAGVRTHSPCEGGPSSRQSDPCTSQARGSEVADLAVIKCDVTWHLSLTTDSGFWPALCGQMQPLATSSSCWGQQVLRASRWGSSISPTNSHLGTVWAMEIEEGKKVRSPRKPFSWKTWMQRRDVLPVAFASDPHTLTPSPLPRRLPVACPDHAPKHWMTVSLPFCSHCRDHCDEGMAKGGPVPSKKAARSPAAKIGHTAASAGPWASPSPDTSCPSWRVTSCSRVRFLSFYLLCGKILASELVGSWVLRSVLWAQSGVSPHTTLASLSEGKDKMGINVSWKELDVASFMWMT